ncbi:MAG: GAF domain-containing sensor histidine kinase, partial [Candidatus Marsarchaeota archaeon]|nr:GAF domain-containing sensor histidine kinase [Candidatus Marsarchaeota archaeon]
GIVAVTNVDRCWILLLDESGEFLLPAYVAGLSPDLEQFFYGSVVEVKRVRFFRELLSGWEPIISHDAPTDSRLRGRIIDLFQMKSLLGLPLKVHDRSIGVIYVDYSKAAHHFTSDEVHLASSLASLAALAIENSRLYTHEQQKRREATVLLDLATAISSTLDLPKVLSLVAKASLDATRVEQCTILLSSDSGGCLVPKLGVARDDGGDYAEVKCSRQARISEFRLQEEVLAGRPVAVLSIATETRPAIRTWLQAVNAASALVVPLFAKEQLNGVILLGSSRPEHVFRDEEVRVVLGVAGQAAVAVENAILFSELAQKELTLRGLVNKIIHAQEEERRRIAADVHDEVIQSVMGMWYRIQACQKWLKMDPGEASQELDVLKSSLETSLQSLRRIILNLRPATLDDYGFVPTLRSFSRSFEQETDIRVSLFVRGTQRLAPELESCLYRLVQEATSNIRKHSGASNCRIVLVIGLRQTLLSVKDNGRGFNVAQTTPSEGVQARFGLVSMRERVALVGGSIRIESWPGAGTVIRVRVPTTLRGEEKHYARADQGVAGRRSSNDQGGTASDASHGAQHRDRQRG